MMDQFPPRGSGVRGRQETLPSALWATPDQFGEEWVWRPGRVLLGQWRGRLVGFEDDRHLLTVAGTRAGKTSTVLLHNLARWPGSMVVMDPKGELARATAKVRSAMGQKVHVLDPFGELRGTFPTSASYNAFGELGFGENGLVAPDAAIAADALLVANEKDPHWTDAARNLVRAITLFDLARTGSATLRSLRRTLQSSSLADLFERMALSDAFDEVVANAGSSFLAKLNESPREFASILSTAQEQTAPLDDVRHISDRSDFSLRDLSGGGSTIYAILPGTRMPTHFRWLRLLVQMALAAVERSRRSIRSHGRRLSAMPERSRPSQSARSRPPNTSQKCWVTRRWWSGRPCGSPARPSAMAIPVSASSFAVRGFSRVRK